MPLRDLSKQPSSTVACLLANLMARPFIVSAKQQSDLHFAGPFYSPCRQHSACTPLPLSPVHPPHLLEVTHARLSHPSYQSVQAYYVLRVDTYAGRTADLGGRWTLNAFFFLFPLTLFFSFWFFLFLSYGSTQGFTIRQRSKFLFPNDDDAK